MMNDALNTAPYSQIRDYVQLMRLDKRIGIYLVLWPALWTLWIAAEGTPPLGILLIFIAGAVVMRSAGCVINDFADRDFDGHVSRTRDRPLAAGRISNFEALLLFALLSMVALALVLALNTKTILLSLVGIVLTISYPFMKRFHYLPQVHLGTAFAWAVPMAWTAVTDSWPNPNVWLVFVATILWTTAYDTIYAMVDREDDLKIGLKSSAILFGDLDKFMVGVFQVMFFSCLVLLGRNLQLGSAWTAALAATAILLLYQQFLIRLRRPDECFRAFLNNNLVGFVIFLGLAAPSLVEPLQNLIDSVRSVLT